MLLSNFNCYFENVNGKSSTLEYEDHLMVKRTNMEGAKLLNPSTSAILAEAVGMEIAELIQNLEMLILALDEKNYDEQFEKGFRLIFGERKICVYG
jgi:hypothetical protein